MRSVSGDELMRGDYQICSRCIMDTTDPEISFDGNGICSHCKNYERRAKSELFDPETRRERLEAIVDQIRRDGRSRKYDCVIGVSGGVDSTTVAYTVKKLGLRPLAVHLDNGWDAELAIYNIEKTLKRLQIELFTYVIEWEEFRDLQMSFFNASVANVEVLTDHAIMAILFKTAAQNNVRHVISGGNLVTEAIMPQSWMYDPRDLRHITSIHKQFGSLPLKTFPRCSLLEYSYYIFVRRMKYLPILNYVEYNKIEAKNLIQKELCWRDYGGKHYESIFTRFFQAYYLPKKFGIDKRRAHLSTLISSGQLSREAALEEIKKPLYAPGLFEEDFNFFLKKMRLSSDDWARIMGLPIKTHRDYPSNSLIFRQSPWIVRYIKSVVKP